MAGTASRAVDLCQAIGGLLTMAKCEVCDKGMQTGHRISITRSQVSRRANRMWRSNIKKVQIVEKNGAVRRAKVCTRCLRSKAVTRSV